jgi:hypothetical protein
VDSVIAMVCFGAVLEVRARKSNAKGKAPPTSAAFTEILRQRGVDLLFRVASSALAAGAAPKVKSAKKTGLLYSAEELEAAIR